MRSCLWKLEPGFWTYAIMAGYVFWANGPNIVFRPQQVPRSRHFFEILWFYCIYLIILEKMSFCLWKLESGFWTYGWIHLLGPVDDRLLWSKQISHVPTKLNQAIGILSKLRSRASLTILKMTYHSLFCSHLVLYGSAELWGQSNITSQNKIQKLQNSLEKNIV